MEKHDESRSGEPVPAEERIPIDRVAAALASHDAVRRHVDHLKGKLPNVDVSVGGPAFTLDTNGWAASELLDLEALLGERPLPGGEEG